MNKKEIIFILMMMCACFSINAQWVEDSVSFKYEVQQSEDVTFTFARYKNAAYGVFMLEVTGDKFITSGLKYKSFGDKVLGTVVIYNPEGDVKETISDFCFNNINNQFSQKLNQIHSCSETAAGLNNEAYMIKVLRALFTDNCSVRFIVPMYNTGDFDFTVKPLN